MSAASDSSDDGAEFFRPPGGGTPSSAGGLGAVASPSWRPEIRELRPCHRDAQNAFDTLKTSLSKLDGDLSAPTVSKQFKTLEKTTETVRAWFDASQAGFDKDMSALGDVFTDVESSLDAVAFQQGMKHLDTMFAKVAAQLQRLDPSSAEYMTAATSFREADNAFQAAQIPNADLSQCATEAQTAVGDLAQASKGYTSFLEHQMQAAETEVRDLRSQPAVATDAHSLRADTEIAMNALETVLSSGDSAPTGTFDMDGFVQLLYSKNALGSTISAAANRYTASQEDIALFQEAIKEMRGEGDSLCGLAQDISGRMFSASELTPIDLGAYLSEIMAKVPTAEESLKKAMEHMRPITLGDRNIPATGG